MFKLFYTLILSMFFVCSANANNGDTQSNAFGMKSIFSFLNFSPNQQESKEKKEQALKTTQELADSGDVNAQLFIAYSYLYGQNDFAVDYQKAFDYYSLAAAQDSPIALNNLGSLYYSGIGVERNSAKAAALFTRAATLGNTEAAVNLGFILISGNGAEKNSEKAMMYFEQAANNNNPTAQFMLGYAYYTGKLRPQNYTLAAELIKKAADAGFDEAQYVMAMMYIKGEGYPQNYGFAINNLKKSVEQGRVEAMMTLADILAKGSKYKKDNYRAHVLFNLSAVKNVAGAAQRRVAVERQMKLEEVLQAQTEANNYQPRLTELSTYIRNTFGANLRSYIDDAI